MRRYLILSLVGFLTSACAPLTPRGAADWAPVAETLKQPCPEPPPLPNGSHQTVEAWAVQRGFDYRDCQARQQGLADAVRLREKLIGVNRE